MPCYIWRGCTNLQGTTSSAPAHGTFSGASTHQSPPSLHTHFLGTKDRLVQPLVYRRSLPCSGSRTYKGNIYADAGRQSWDLGRFLKTFYFFNGPPSPAKVRFLYFLFFLYNIRFLSFFLLFVCNKYLKVVLLIEFIVKFIASLLEKLSSGTSTESVKKMEASDVVLVAGATGGVGRRVVDILREKRIPFRVLVSYRTWLPFEISCYFTTFDPRFTMFNIGFCNNMIIFLRSGIKTKPCQCLGRILTWWVTYIPIYVTSELSRDCT